jgi:hypothetical protein
MPQDIMFPTTSDILPEWYEAYLKRINSILSAGHSLVLVSKPHIEVWDKLSRELAAHKDRIIVRFTMASQDDELLKLLEPGAPRFEERLKCLKIMHGAEYRTSVSMEPAIDLLNTPDTIKIVLPYVNTDLWVGTLNNLPKIMWVNQDKPEVLKAFDQIIRNQQDTPTTRELLRRIQALSPKIVFKQGDRGKADFRLMLGLPPGVFGVGEWGDNKEKPEKYNLLKGCWHDCAYCYAKARAMNYSKNKPEGDRVTEDMWCNPVLLKGQPKCYRDEQ